MPEPAYIEELRITAFKSFKNARFALSPLTVLIGRNGSGKSNALEALELLVSLASGDDLTDAFECVRGGAEGSAPHGEKEVVLGCRVRRGSLCFDLDVRIETEPRLRVVFERLGCVSGQRHGATSLSGRELLVTEPSQANRLDVWARYFNGRRGLNPQAPFMSSRLLTSQVAGRVPGTPDGTRHVHEAASSVVAALTAVFVLDPVPHLMRGYVNERDSKLRRNGDNLSAAYGALQKHDPAAAQKLLAVMQQLAEQSVRKVSTERSPLGDVILAVHERDPNDGRRQVKVSARAMSDGMLRFMAIATALLSAPRLEDAPVGGATQADEGQRMLVVEEIENGLHPTQAARVAQLLEEESISRRVRTLITTHSPALLNALDGEEHDGVVVCHRDQPNGTSGLTRLVELPGYSRVVAMGALGDVIARGALATAAAEPRDTDPTEFDRFLEAL